MYFMRIDAVFKGESINKSLAVPMAIVLSSRPKETTASGRGGMCSRVTGMSPHMGVRQGTTGFARGAPFDCM